MPTITRASLDAFTDDLQSLGGDLAEMLATDLGALDWDQPVDELREQVTTILSDYCRVASENAGFMASGYYEQVRERSVGSRLGAEPYSAFDVGANEGAVRAFMQDIVGGGDVESVIRKCAERIDRDIKRSAALTMTANAQRDPARPRFARVPSGGETCDFCLMLASRGAVYATAQTAGEMDHYHANCRCRVVPVWGSKSVKTDAGGIVRRGGTQYEGYDPDEYFEQYLQMALNPLPDGERAGAQAEADIASRLGDGDRGAWRAASEQGLTKFGDIHEVTEYIREAESFEDMRERLKAIDREIRYYGLSDKQYERILELCRSMRSKFLRS